MRPLIVAILSGLLLGVSVFAATSASGTRHASPQFREGQFHNADPMPEHSATEMARLIWDFMFNAPEGTVPAGAIPVRAMTRSALLAAPDNTLYRLGHSSTLIKLGGEFYLLDPVFSKRASPVQWAGPARFHEAPISIEELPPIKGVFISHDHYDHLDHATIKALAKKTQFFLTPLGVGERLVDWGVDAAKVQQFDWWEGGEIDGLRFVATPAKHFSGRSLTDGNATLWASWVFMHGDVRLFYSGDSGYFGGFKEIGAKYGPFDVAIIENGAYDKQWPDVHMQPEETLQAFADVKGAWLLPVHNGTFDLGLHRWQAPFERIAALAAQQRVSLTTPQIGEAVSLKQPQAGQPWWRGVK
ncbi:MBL fold metallo-hydrolase [Massilia sp. CMS3.1]|uniref:MBL fold metallo-hydrolase n=1 Tax=Massilia sp. CMS3.1 TaxID=3373083 RepID=UPI003EE79521